MLLTALIVTQNNIKLFLGEITISEAEAHQMGLIWMLGNALRLFCVGMATQLVLRVQDAIRK